MIVDDELVGCVGGPLTKGRNADFDDLLAEIAAEKFGQLVERD
jgi:hypothetical protein